MAARGSRREEKLSINVWVGNVGENLIIGPNVSH
jgi:hypothetical protein